MASTGLSLEAVQAGTNPEIRPIKADTKIPSIILANVSVNVKLKTDETTMVSANTISKPTSPPIRERKMDSNKN